MSNPTIHITAAMTAHQEGIMAALSLKSFLDCIAHAENGGLVVEKIIALDCANDATKDVFSDANNYNAQLIETDFGDQGLVRNVVVEASKGEYVAFLDSDDLWSYNWLLEAYKLCSMDPGRIIAHPEVDWFFQGNNNLFVMADQADPSYVNDFLRIGNYWDALCLAPRNAHLNFPFCQRDIKGGFAYEDWQWNCQTLAAGFLHRVAAGTIHFKRRREGSQTLEASKSKTIMRPNALCDYSWYEGRDQVE
jgi:glycosyltransferase involved in cell wall biosynthesis